MFEQFISNDAKRALELLAPVLSSQTYLAGGTALALRIGHRKSFDLDLYTKQQFSEEQLVEKIIQTDSAFLLLASQWQTIEFSFLSTNVTLFYYPYQLLKKPDVYTGVPIASLQDIAAMKCEAIAGRGLKRDFFDLYQICMHMHASLYDVILWNRKKYGKERNTLMHIVKSLTFFEDADHDNERIELSDDQWKIVKTFFLKEAPIVFEKLLAV